MERIEEVQLKKRCPTHVIRPRVFLYSWKWLDKEGTLIRESPQWYYSEAVCRNEESATRKKRICPQHDTDLIIGFRMKETLKPTSFRVLLEVLHSVFFEGINQCARENCKGCALDAVNLEAHMGDGCLMEWNETLSQYWEKARGLVINDKCSMWCRNALYGMQYPIGGIEEQIEGVLQSVSKEEWIALLLNYEDTEEARALRRHVLDHRPHQYRAY